MVILDGWGIAPVWGGNAIAMSNTPNFSGLWNKYPHTTLLASDGAVGLPKGAPGNSEAGHLNIGAGQVVHQDQPIIDKQIADGTFFTNKVLLQAIDSAKKNNSKLHLMGLLSKTGTHSQLLHLYALLELAKQQNFSNVFIHLFSDGRDSDPMSGIEMVSELEQKIQEVGVGRIVSVIGRFYAMDRDHRWARVAAAYNMLTQGVAHYFADPKVVFGNSYSRGITDEFIEPSIIGEKGGDIPLISDNDSIIFFNFRSDRAKELTEAFTDPEFAGFPRTKTLKNIYFATFVLHDDARLGHPAFLPEKVEMPLAEIWSEAGLRQYHTAETEKYAHVTFFFNGGREKPFAGEDWHLIPSPRNVRTYDELPEMSAWALTNSVVLQLRRNLYDVFVINYANVDMVGHTGNMKAEIRAVEFVDLCLGRIAKDVLARDGMLFICADHGNGEQMVNPRTGEQDTEHTTDPVPFIFANNRPEFQNIKFRADGALANIAPTMLQIMNIPFDQTKKEKSLIITNNQLNIQ